MQRHLRVVARPQPLRPAKVVQLEARREARLEAVRLHAVEPPRKPAA